MSYNSTPPFKLKLLQDRTIVVLSRVYKSLLSLAPISVSNWWPVRAPLKSLPSSNNTINI